MADCLMSIFGFHRVSPTDEELERLKKSIELVRADFTAVGMAGNKPEAVEIVRLTTG